MIQIVSLFIGVALVLIGVKMASLIFSFPVPGEIYIFGLVGGIAGGFIMLLFDRNTID